MAKKEKILDLKPETITKEQLTKVQETVNNINRYQLEIGNMTVKQHELMHSVASFRDELSLLQQEFSFLIISSLHFIYVKPLNNIIHILNFIL